MQELVDADIPFERKEVPLAEAIEYFRKLGYDDILPSEAFVDKTAELYSWVGERTEEEE